MDKRINPHMTNKEGEVMEVLWGVSRALSISEICDNAEIHGLSLNQSTAQSAINNLMKKGLVCVGEITQNNKALARAFIPTIRPDQYTVLKYRELVETTGHGYGSKKPKDKKIEYLSTLLNDVRQDEDVTSADIEKLIKSLKETERK